MSVEHYENFPVASWLCPARLRPPITAIYWFARVADDIADEGSAPEAQRRADLAEYRAELARVATGRAPGSRWAAVFEPLATAIRDHALPVRLLDDLIDAFVQDTGNPLYPDRQALLAYCRRSADPIGRLLLHLYGIRDERALARSDAICSALQLINFWQDLSVDLPRGRCYVPQADASRHGLHASQLRAGPATPAEKGLVRELCQWAGDLMREGAPLARELPGRIGWELRLVVQGGLRILEKIAEMDHATLSQRPALSRRDAPRLLWRALFAMPGGAR
ncbi:squalene synthase HpnC [Ideonella sp. YS5]|uniref:squalene synthase HpnC n=1 Tax=Ideonella sp. YS5 TaxID=3453714 RepID=UPI003EEE6C53